MKLIRLIAIVSFGLSTYALSGCGAADPSSDDPVVAAASSALNKKIDKLTGCVIDCMGHGSKGEENGCMRDCFCKFGTSSEQTAVGVMCLDHSDTRQAPMDEPVHSPLGQGTKESEAPGQLGAKP